MSWSHNYGCIDRMWVAQEARHAPCRAFYKGRALPVLAHGWFANIWDGKLEPAYIGLRHASDGPTRRSSVKIPIVSGDIETALAQVMLVAG
jgi:hypothetical protein